MNAQRGGWVMNAKEPMECGGAALGERAEAGAKRFITAGSWRKAVEKGAQIESGAAGDEWESLPVADPGERLPAEAGVRAGRQFAVNAHDVDQVVWDAAARGNGKLGGPDIHSPIYLNRIAVDDFSLERFGEKQGECALAGARGPQYGDQRPDWGNRVNRHRGTSNQLT